MASAGLGEGTTYNDPCVPTFREITPSLLRSNAESLMGLLLGKFVRGSPLPPVLAQFMAEIDGRRV
jgi:hypothetical protein